MKSPHFEKLERMYLAANINTKIFDTTTINIQEDATEIGLTISEDYFHALGAIHGSVYFKLLDDAAFFAASALVPDVFVLTTSFNINIIRPVNKGVIKAIGKIRYQSRNLLIAESRLFNQEGKEIAFGTGNFTKSKNQLSENIGYK